MIILAVLPKLTCSRRDCSNEATDTWDDKPVCKLHLIILERMEE